MKFYAHCQYSLNNISTVKLRGYRRGLEMSGAPSRCPPPCALLFHEPILHNQGKNNFFEMRKKYKKKAETGL